MLAHPLPHPRTPQVTRRSTGLVWHGSTANDGYAGAIAEVQCTETIHSDHSFVIDRAWIEADQKKALAALWPLKKGKSATFRVRFGSIREDRIDYQLYVADVETAKIEGSERPLYVIKGKVEFPGCDGNGEYDQTWWYDPAQGVVVRSKRVRAGGNDA